MTDTERETIKEAIAHLKETGEYPKDNTILFQMYSYYKSIEEAAFVDPRYELMEQHAIREWTRIRDILEVRLGSSMR